MGVVAAVNTTDSNALEHFKSQQGQHDRHVLIFLNSDLLEPRVFTLEFLQNDSTACGSSEAFSLRLP